MQAAEGNPPKDPAAGEGLIEQIVKKYIEDDVVVFVFPTEIAAAMWQERALDFHPRAVLPDERFMAWDRFKGIHAARAEKGKAEIHERIRELYAENLGERNAAAAKKGKPLLRFAIPAEFAESASLFSAWIANVLPHLALWKERRERQGAALAPADAEDEDIEFIFKDYKAFLESSSLFEPSWCRRFEGGGKKHIIFFHEAIQGFSAYRQALNPNYISGKPGKLPDAARLADFTAVSAPAFDGENALFELHDNFREEFRSVALKIESLLMRGERADAIAVSLSDAQESECYLSRELETRGIPARIRIKRALAESGAGRVFPLIQQCKAEGFSFNSVKRLLSLKSIAWRNPEQAAALIQFGIENRCICSWRDGGKLVDIWESAGKGADFRVKWYRELKKNVLALAGAKSFADVRSRWFAFRNSLLDAQKMGFSGDGSEAGKSKESLEIGRCIDELDELVEAEKAFPGLAPRNPFSFFVARLKKTTYVPQSKAGGVSVFKLKDVVAAPFKFHFITGATQEDATALHGELRFLRKDKREALGAPDEDASLHLFSSYISGAESGSRVFFSASRRAVGVSAYKTAHSAFAVRARKDENDAPFPGLPDDPLEMEEMQEKPRRIYPAQKAGFEAYSIINADKASRFSFLKEGFEGSAADEETLRRIKERIAKKEKNGGQDVRVSATDLNAFAECPAKWFLKRALKLKEREFSPGLDLVDAGEKGTVFHEVAKSLYELIREKDGAFRKDRSQFYLKEAEKIIRGAIEKDLAPAIMKSPLGALACPALEAKLKKWVEALVSADSALLDGFIPVMTEREVCYSEDGIEYAGRIDRISESEGGESTVIVDYKTGSHPETKDYRSKEIKDFQMPFYVFLCKKKLEKDVTQAWFFSAAEQKYIRILDTDDGAIKASGGNGFKSADEFERETIEAMKTKAAAFARAASAASFSAEGVYASDCQACDFKAVCRRAYSVARD